MIPSMVFAVGKMINLPPALANQGGLRIMVHDQLRLPAYLAAVTIISQSD
jgi:hypothetical protein